MAYRICKLEQGKLHWRRLECHF